MIATDKSVERASYGRHSRYDEARVAATALESAAIKRSHGCFRASFSVAFGHHSISLAGEGAHAACVVELFSFLN